jgi:hypothetical protein
MLVLITDPYRAIFAGAKVPYTIVNSRAAGTVAVWAATALASVAVSVCLTAAPSTVIPLQVPRCPTRWLTVALVTPWRFEQPPSWLLLLHPYVSLLPMHLHTTAGAKVPYKVVDRRAGDTVAVWAATELAESLLGWKSKLDLADMCRDQWRWAQNYPQVHFV